MRFKFLKINNIGRQQKFKILFFAFSLLFFLPIISYQEISLIATVPASLNNLGDKTLIQAKEAYNIKRYSSVSIPLSSVAVNPPESTISISGTLGFNGWYTSDVTISLYASKHSSGLLKIEYTFYNKSWTTYSMPFKITEEGQTVIFFRAHDLAGNIEPTKMQTVDIDKTPPNGSVLIEDGAIDVYKTNINLKISATDIPLGPTTIPPTGYYWGVPSGPADMRFSNNALIWSNWETYNENRIWQLDTGSGNKTVYVQVRDNAGLVSATFTDTVNLVTTGDSVPPETVIELRGSQEPLGVYTSEVIIILSSSDDLSGIELIEYSFDGKKWNVYQMPFTVNTKGETNIYYRSSDRAGNAEQIKSQTIFIDIEDKSFFGMPYFLVYSFTVLILGGFVAIVITRRKKNVSKNKNNHLILDKKYYRSNIVRTQLHFLG
jgi:hypothetical protein